MQKFYCKCLRRYKSSVILAYLIFIIILHYEKHFLNIISNVSSKLTLACFGTHVFSNVLKTLLEKNIQKKTKKKKKIKYSASFNV